VDFSKCYTRAPKGAPDNYVLTRPVRFRWSDPPQWVADLFVSGGRSRQDDPIRTRDGALYLYDAIPPSVCLDIREGFHFDVSVAPSFKGAMAGACLHDFLYGHSKPISRVLGCTVRDVLALADKWFLSQMHADSFLLKRTYYAAVRTFGYAFNRLGRAFSRK